MPVFISHSFDDRPELDNLTEALTQGNVEYGDSSAEVRPGNSLRDQLRRAVKDCSVCIFIATRSSLLSNWCGSELGAFWGAGKPIIIYLAEPSLKDADLPQILQGDVWERRISRVVAQAGELLRYSRISLDAESQIHDTRIGSMTAEHLERIITGAISLAMADSKESHGATYEEISRSAKGAAVSVAEGLKEAQQTVDASHSDLRKRILWVDDRPDHNIYERRAFESLGIEFTLALSTEEALTLVSKRRFGAILSDMGRTEGPREGYALLEALRSHGDQTPFFIYAGSNSAQHKREAKARGAQGTTNNAQELFEMVRDVLR
jgi:CheY-like chemotaxis protein